MSMHFSLVAIMSLLNETLILKKVITKQTTLPCVISLVLWKVDELYYK